MNNWFGVKASYDKTMENGTQKKSNRVVSGRRFIFH